MTVAITLEGVFLPAKVCAALRHPLQRDLQAALREQAAVAPEIVAAVELIDAVGAWWENKSVANVAADVAQVDSRRCDAIDWLTVSETAAELTISEAAVKGLLKRGTLHGARGPRSWRVCSESVSARMKGQKCDHLGATDDRRQERTHDVSTRSGQGRAL